MDGYSNGAYDGEKSESYTPRTETAFDGDVARKKKQRMMFIAILLVDLAVSLGVGIGIGFAIGDNNNSNDSEPIKATREPTSGPPRETTSAPPPLPEHWVDLPCMTETKCPAGVTKPPMIIISLDGFRDDFMHRGLTPNLEKLRTCGIKAPHMIPTFPTLTFPNHYTQVTGLYPESHGIIGNNMYDPSLGSFSLSSSNKFKTGWWGGEPIWNTAKKQGLRTATYFWVGSDVEIQGMRPDYWFLYADAEYLSRVDVLVALLSQPEGLRPDLLTLYYDEPDHTGHDPGPNTPEEDEQIRRMDGIIGYLMDGLMRIGFHDCIDVIVMADHGMANRTCDQLYVLDDYIEESDYYIRSTGGTMLRLDPKSSAEISEPKDVVDHLKCTHPVAIPYVKTDIPKRWHYVNNIRIEDILITVPAGWTANSGSTSWCDGGTHGYDNLDKMMRALFIASGPSFRSGITVEPFQNIELYELMCEILDIYPAPNNGTRGALHHFLKNPKFLPSPAPTNTSTPVECNFPENDDAYNTRLEEDTSGCNCNSFTESEIKAFNSRLKTVTDNVAKHAPFGVPIVQFHDEVCQLPQENYITGFSHRQGVPLYATYTITKDQITQLGEEISDCFSRPDVRLPVNTSSHDCSFLESGLDGDVANVTTGYLYPPSLGQTEEEIMDALITSNSILQFKGFRKDMWDGFLFQQVANWADAANGINVITGPIYDFDADGIADEQKAHGSDSVILPTHFFMIVSRCSGNQEISSSCSDIETATFILPNMDGIYTCQTSADYVEHHRASISDVELLTGLSFYPDISINFYEQIKLRANIHARGDLWRDWPLM